jgi:hypothetical protein
MLASLAGEVAVVANRSWSGPRPLAGESASFTRRDPTTAARGVREDERSFNWSTAGEPPIRRGPT